MCGLVCRSDFVEDEQIPADIEGNLSTLMGREVLADGTIKMADISKRRAWWSKNACDRFPLLSAAAVRLLSAHATTAAAERNWSSWGKVFVSSRSKLKIKKAEKLIYIKNNQHQDKQERRLHYQVKLDVLGVESDHESSDEEEEEATSGSDLE